MWETFCNFWHFSRRIFFFSHGRRSFLFCIDGCWWRCGAPKQFVSLALTGEGAGVGAEKGGAWFDLLYLFLFSVSEVTAD